MAVVRLVTLLLLAVAVACGSSPQPKAVVQESPIDGVVLPRADANVRPYTVIADPNPSGKPAVLKDVRASAHPEQGGWDRIVFEFADHLPAAEIGYEQRALSCTSGQVLSVSGGLILLVRFDDAKAHDDAGKPTAPLGRLQGPGNAVVELRQLCDFEGDVTWAIGVKGERPYAVTTLREPARLVIDVKW